MCDGSAAQFVAWVLRSTPGTLFTFGASGAGKTHTLLGGLSGHAAPGTDWVAAGGGLNMWPAAGAAVRAAADLLTAVNQEGAGRTVEVFVVEVDFGVPVDLMDGSSAPAGAAAGSGRAAQGGSSGLRGGGGGSTARDRPAAAGVWFARHADGCTRLAGATTVAVSSLAQFCTIVGSAMARRRTARTALNQSSSRSHAFISLTVARPPSSRDTPPPLRLVYVSSTWMGGSAWRQAVCVAHKQRRPSTKTRISSRSPRSSRPCADADMCPFGLRLQPP